jgi:hypothetical protein
VKAFGKVFDNELPVGVHIDDDAFADPQLVEPVAREPLGQLAQGFRERPRLASVEVDEHEAAPGRGGYLE